MDGIGGYQIVGRDDLIWVDIPELAGDPVDGFNLSSWIQSNRVRGGMIAQGTLTDEGITRLWYAYNCSWL